MGCRCPFRGFDGLGPRPRVYPRHVTITPVQQRNNVSEGVAFGLALHHIDRLAQPKTTIDLAFTGAWRTWSQVELFPQVNTDMRTLDGYRILTRADQRKETHAFYWERDGTALIAVPRDPDWNAESTIDVDFAQSVIDERINSLQWAALAGAFLTRLRARATNPERS